MANRENDIYKNYNNGKYYTIYILDTNIIEDAKKFTSSEFIVSDKYFRISYNEEYKNIIKNRRKEKLEQIKKNENTNC